MGVKEVGAYVRALRQQNGLTQQGLAVAAGVGKNYIWKIEAGRIDNPGSPRMSAVVRVLKGSLEEIGRLMADVEDAQLSAEIESLPPQERDARRRQVQQLTDELLSDPRKLERWIGYGERLREEG